MISSFSEDDEDAPEQVSKITSVRFLHPRTGRDLTLVMQKSPLEKPMKVSIPVTKVPPKKEEEEDGKERKKRAVTSGSGQVAFVVSKEKASFLFFVNVFFAI